SAPIPSPKATNPHDCSAESLMPDSLSNSHIELLLGTLKRQAKQRAIVSSSALLATAKSRHGYGIIRTSLGSHNKPDQVSVSTHTWQTVRMSWWKNETNHSAHRSPQRRSGTCPETAAT